MELDVCKIFSLICRLNPKIADQFSAAVELIQEFTQSKHRWRRHRISHKCGPYSRRVKFDGDRNELSPPMRDMASSAAPFVDYLSDDAVEEWRHASAKMYQLNPRSMSAAMDPDEFNSTSSAYESDASAVENDDDEFGQV